MSPGWRAWAGRLPAPTRAASDPERFVVELERAVAVPLPGERLSKAERRDLRLTLNELIAGLGILRRDGGVTVAEAGIAASVIALAGFLMPIDFGLMAVVASVGAAGYAYYRDRIDQVEAEAVQRLEGRLLSLIDTLR